jgi:hypothetical protein
MIIKVDKFGGMAPKIDPLLLPDHLAQSALDCKLGSGTLRAWKAPLSVVTPSKVGTKQSIYLYGGQYWFHWLEDVDVVRGPIAGDAFERTYWTGDGAPKVTDSSIATAGGGTGYPNNSWALGIPAPATPPSVAVVGSATSSDPALLETRQYVVTYVSGYGEEGAPCDLTAAVDVWPGQSVNLSSIPVAPVGNYNITSKRIYRTNTNSSGDALLQLVAEIGIATTTYSDTKTGAQLGEVIPSADTENGILWSVPPTGLKGLISLPNGSLAGFVGNELCFSEPYQPHAWPGVYRVTLDHPIVAIAAFGNSILVTTTNLPYIVTGSDPLNMSVERLEVGQSCVSKRSMVDMGYYCIYAAPDGLALVGSGRAEIITKDVLDFDYWQGLNPSSIHGYLFDSLYVGFYNNGNTGGFIFDPKSGDFTLISTYATAGYTDPATGDLYLCVNGVIVKWDAGATYSTPVWKSKPWLAPRPTNFGAAQVFAPAYPVTLKVYADGTLKHTQTVASSAPFRLPAGFLADKWEFEATGEVTSIAMASTMGELRGA